jgi:hypothetical protein
MQGSPIKTQPGGSSAIIFVHPTPMRPLLIICILLLTNCGQPVERNADLIAASNDTTLAIRGDLHEIQPGLYRLDYYDVYQPDSHYEMLDTKGYQGGGPSWMGIIDAAIQMSDPTLMAAIRFDDEAEGLAIWSQDRETLVRIGRLIAALKQDERFLLKAVEVAERNGNME